MNRLARLVPWKNPDTFQMQDYRLFVVIRVIAFLGLLVQSSFCVFFLSLALWPMAGAHFFGVLIWLATLAANRHGHYSMAVVMMASEVAFHSLIATYLVGWDAGFHFYLLAAIPISFLNPRHRERGSLIAILCTVVGLSIILESQAQVHPIMLSETLTRGINSINIFMAFAALGLSCHYFRHASLLTEKKIYQLANTDELTGLLNRRHMEAILRDQIEHIHRYGGNMTLILADIDKFKSINDQYGHICGDKVLQEVSDILTDKLRKTDWICRWGGEEFLLLLTNTDLRGASIAAEKLRSAIEARPIRYDSFEFNITATFGMAEYQTGDQINQTIALADAMLYQGKRLGRNRVESALQSESVMS